MAMTQTKMGNMRTKVSDLGYWFIIPLWLFIETWRFTQLIPVAQNNCKTVSSLILAFLISLLLCLDKKLFLKLILFTRINLVPAGVSSICLIQISVILNLHTIKDLIGLVTDHQYAISNALCGCVLTPNYLSIEDLS